MAHIIPWIVTTARSADGTFILWAAYTNPRAGRELISIADKNYIKVSYDDTAFLNEVVRRLQPVKRIKIAEKEHNGFKKAYIELKSKN